MKSPLIVAVLIGLGATLTFDCWALFLKRVFGIIPSNIGLVGRWVLYMRDGVFAHANIAASPPKRSERLVGWSAHYVIGCTLAIAFVLIVGVPWLHQPNLLPALVYGVVTVLAPFCLMQPAFGLGFAASRTARPWQARFRSLLNHTAYGVGLYLFALLASRMGWS